jgi:hypothetical protein
MLSFACLSVGRHGASCWLGVAADSCRVICSVTSGLLRSSLNPALGGPRHGRSLGRRRSRAERRQPKRCTVTRTGEQPQKPGRWRPTRRGSRHGAQRPLRRLGPRVGRSFTSSAEPTRWGRRTGDAAGFERMTGLLVRDHHVLPRVAGLGHAVAPDFFGFGDSEAIRGDPVETAGEESLTGGSSWSIRLLSATSLWSARTSGRGRSSAGARWHRSASTASCC